MMTTITNTILIINIGFLLTFASPISDDPASLLNCSVNETVSGCPLCDRDCSQLHIYDAWSNRNRPCPEKCFKSAAICICKPGFYRNSNGICVSGAECPPACPWANEIANYCDLPYEPRCQPTCSNPTIHPNGTIVILDEDAAVFVPQFYCQYGICHTLVCACKPGYVRHDDTLNCIKESECPTLSPAPDANSNVKRKHHS